MTIQEHTSDGVKTHTLTASGDGVFPQVGYTAPCWESNEALTLDDARQFEVSPPSLRFGACPPGQTREVVLRITNVGVVPVHFTIPQLDDCVVASATHGEVPVSGLGTSGVAAGTTGESKGVEGGEVGWTEIAFTFSPPHARRLYRGTFRVECGTRYAMVDWSGYGGTPSFSVRLLCHVAGKFFPAVADSSCRTSQVMPSVLSLGMNTVRGRVGTDVRVRNTGDVPIRWEVDRDSRHGTAGMPEDPSITDDGDGGKPVSPCAQPRLELYPHHGALLPGEEENVLALTVLGAKPGPFSTTVVLRGAAHTRHFNEALDLVPTLTTTLSIVGTAKLPEAAEP